VTGDPATFRIQKVFESTGIKMKTLDIGFIGCGGVFSKRHYSTLKRLPRYRIVACTDTNRTRLDELQRHYGIKSTFTDYRDMLQKVPMDVAAVCSPVTTHAQMALDILDAGLNLFLEKPATFTIEECDQLIDKAKTSPGKILIGYNKRYMPNIRKAKQTLESGELGQIEAAQFLLSTGHRVEGLPHWRKNRALGGGSFIEESCHILDFWTWFSHKPFTRLCSVTSKLGGCDDNPVAFMAENQDGALFQGLVSDTLPDQNHFTILGQEKVMRLFPHQFDGFKIQPRGVYDGDLKHRIRNAVKCTRYLPQLGKLWKLGGVYQLSFYHMWKTFYEAIMNDAPVLNSLEETRNVQILIKALVDAADQNKWIEINRH
jgi:predicted dehydrogenase